MKGFRLLLGKAPEIRSETTLGDVLLKMIREEVEGFELSEDKDNLVKEFIEFLNRENVEVRLYDKEFLHGKAYIFDELVVVGSSNFTPAGLTHNTELNSVSLESEAGYVRSNWFDKFWNEALDFKAGLIRLLEASRFGTREYTPYEVYIKSLYELQKDDIKYEEEGKEEESGRPASKVNLSEFQEDAVRRVFSRLKKYRACMVADSVGLGKTWIAKRIIEEFGFYKRRRFLIVCPAQLRGMWREAVKDLILSESILSQEELASADFLHKAKEAVGSDLKEVSLIVVDESHNFRNPLSNRWENLFTLIMDHIAKGGERPYIVFLTATPINRDIEKDIALCNEMKEKVERIDGEDDAKLKELKKRLLDLSNKGQTIIFTYYADTLDYLYKNVSEDPMFSEIRIEKISGRITSTIRRAEIVNNFMDGKIGILMSTDVLSEGMNLQKARYLINYDLHWNPTRMIQRAGRIDRIGSPYQKIYVYNFFPEEELEDLLRLVEILQNKIRNIDSAVGLDSTILGEEVNPKVFGIIRRIRERDARVFDELENEVFGGGERFYQPLKDYLRTKAVEELESIPVSNTCRYIG